jgi:hypothetical protein
MVEPAGFFDADNDMAALVYFSGPRGNAAPDGKSISAVARTFNVHPATIHRVLEG